MAGIILILLPFMPETSHAKILLKRARRLRCSTGNDNYFAASELKKNDLIQTIKDAMIKPLQISVLDPAVGFVCIYAALVYATYYSFFDAFPLVYLETYGMPIGGLGLIFVSVAIAAALGAGIYVAYLYYYFIPRARRHEEETGELVQKEQWLRPGLAAVLGPPIGLFMFAWTAREDIHWIVPT
jgi:MFS transporter, DHA1 family, multidrug resistance protein